METGEFLLLAYTSSLTLSISGILKEVINSHISVAEREKLLTFLFIKSKIDQEFYKSKKN